MEVTDWVEYTTVGTVTVAPPEHAVSADVVLVGGGAGGANRRGGLAGGWASGTIPISGPITVTVGAGGDTGVGSVGGDSHAGTIRALGGQGQKETLNDFSGQGAGTHTAFGRAFTGGAEQGEKDAGNPPGGGGFGNYIKVYPGARGQVWLRWHLQTKIQNLHVGDRLVQDVRVGGTQVQAVYHGSTLIYGSP